MTDKPITLDVLDIVRITAVLKTHRSKLQASLARGERDYIGMYGEKNGQSIYDYTENEVIKLTEVIDKLSASSRFVAER